jgi:hypothetical protein
MIRQSGTRLWAAVVLQQSLESPQVSFRSVAVALLISASFVGPAAAQFKKDLPPVTCSTVDSIGVAEMAGDGTITLHLKSLWPDAHEDSDLTYAPDDPQYNEIKQHLGGIEPGQSKPIPPFC